MNRKRALWRRLLVAALLVLSLAMLTLYFRESEGGPVHRVQQAGLKLLAPLQSGTSTIVSPFQDAWNWFGDLFTAQSENKRLRAEVAKLQALTARQLKQLRENQRLQSIQLRIEDEDKLFPDGVELIPARIIGRSTEAWYSTVTVNAGTDKGIAMYDPVTDEFGHLAGRVTAVSSGAAQVTLLTDQKSAVGAEILPNEARGVVAGSMTGDVTMDFVDRAEKIERGQIVVTSGASRTLRVRGIPIGVVDDVGKQAVELYQSISIKPLVDFRKLEWVMVVHQ